MSQIDYSTTGAHSATRITPPTHNARDVFEVSADLVVDTPCHSKHEGNVGQLSNEDKIPIEVEQRETYQEDLSRCRPSESRISLYKGKDQSKYFTWCLGKVRLAVQNAEEATVKNFIA
jgi:hypothetical protein